MGSGAFSGVLWWFAFFACVGGFVEAASDVIGRTLEWVFALSRAGVVLLQWALALSAVFCGGLPFLRVRWWFC